MRSISPVSASLPGSEANPGAISAAIQDAANMPSPVTSNSTAHNAPAT